MGRSGKTHDICHARTSCLCVPSRDPAVFGAQDCHGLDAKGGLVDWHLTCNSWRQSTVTLAENTGQKWTTWIHGGSLAPLQGEKRSLLSPTFLGVVRRSWKNTGRPRIDNACIFDTLHQLSLSSCGEPLEWPRSPTCSTP
eukprot:3577645-Amphidinium_carterae.1